MNRQAQIMPAKRLAPLLPPLYFLVLTLLYLMPLPLHWTTHVPGDDALGDSVFHTWPFWYFPYALTHGISPLLHPNLQFYPDGIAMLLTNSNLVGSILMAPISLTLGVCAAVNTWILLQLWLGGWFFFLFVRRLGIGFAAALFAGTAYACSQFISAHLLGHYTLVGIAFPAGILYLGIIIFQSNARPIPVQGGIGILLGCLWAALALTDFYLTIMTIVLFTALIIHLIWTNGIRSIMTCQKGIMIGVGASLSLLLITPFGIELHNERLQKTYEYTNEVPTSDLTISPATLAIPARHNLISRQLLAYNTSFSYLEIEPDSGYVGLVLILVVVIGLFLKIRQLLVWLIYFVLIAGLAGGNSLTHDPIYAHTPMAFGMLWPEIFPFGEFRMPSRWVFAIQFCLTVMAAFSLDALVWRYVNKSKWILVGAFSLLIADHIRPPLLGANGPEFTYIPEKSKLTGTILDIPVCLWSGNGYLAGAYNQAPLRRQMFHHRPILSLFTARLSRDEFEARMADPEFAALIDMQGYTKSPVPPEIPDLDWPGFARRFDITTIRIPGNYRHKDTFKALGERMLPGISWTEYPDEIIGNAPSGKTTL